MEEIQRANIIPYLSWDTDVRFFSLSLINDVDAVDKDVLEAAPEILCGGQVRQVWLYNPSYIQLGEK